MKLIMLMWLVKNHSRGKSRAFPFCSAQTKHSLLIVHIFFLSNTPHFTPLKGFTDNLLSGFGVKDEFGATWHHSGAPRCSPSYEDGVQKASQSDAGR